MRVCVPFYRLWWFGWPSSGGLGSTTTNRRCVAAFDFATVSDYDQLVVGPTDARGGTLDLLMADVPDLLRVAVVAPIGNSDHSSLWAAISMAHAVQTCVLVGKFSRNLKSISIQFVVQYCICHSVAFGLLTILLRFWTNICPCWLDVMYQPRSSVYTTRISLNLTINAGLLIASSRRLIFGGPAIAIGLTGKSLSAVKWDIMNLLGDQAWI